MTVVKDIMNREPVTVEMDTTLERVRNLFTKAATHHIIVVRDREPIGIISDRDVLRTVSPFVGKLSERPQDLSTLNRLAHQVMSRNLITVRPDTPNTEAIGLLLQHRISALPVLSDRGNLIGIVSWRDLLRYCAESGQSDGRACDAAA